jgi:hypothetical protein
LEIVLQNKCMGKIIFLMDMEEILRGERGKFIVLAI